MRKIVASLGMSLDGVIEAPWAWPVKDNTEETDSTFWSLVDSSDALLMGRVTFGEFAQYWADEKVIRSEQVKRKPLMDNMQKYVVSSVNIDTSAWANSTLIKDNVAEEITKLKQRPGKNITVPASATLVGWLLHEGLLDELHLFLFPMVLGKGKRLFEEGAGQAVLTLISSQNLNDGIMHLVYRTS